MKCGEFSAVISLTYATFVALNPDTADALEHLTPSLLVFAGILHCNIRIDRQKYFRPRSTGCDLDHIHSGYL